jgi:hypothetical protein
MAKRKRTTPKVVDPFEDGPKVPVQLLGEIRAAFAEHKAAEQESVEHNERGRIIQRRINASAAVLEHYLQRARAKFNLKDTDMIDFERGIVRIKRPTQEGAQ